MTLLLNEFRYQLRLRVDNDLPSEHLQQWNELKNLCESGNNRGIVERIKSVSNLSAIKNIPYLNRLEGGFGGNNNIIHKQARFRNKLHIMYNDNDIMIDEIIDTPNEKWTFEELSDIIEAFVKVANSIIKAECTNGCIEMIRTQPNKK